MPQALDTQTILSRFLEHGAARVEPDILQPAGTLLDLYGEDIRARAFVTQDSVEGEMMLRPDFTVPVVQAHMAGGAEPARYAYAGPVFRRQDDANRPREYTQVGFEVFDRENMAAADAEVFALFSELLAPYSATAFTGDIGILIAAVDTLKTSPRRRAALRRHIWRPHRFRALMDRFAGQMPPTRAALIADQRPPEELARAFPEIGKRSAREVAERIDILRLDAQEPPISAEECAMVEAVLGVSDTAPNALETFRQIAVEFPGLNTALDRFETRLRALEQCGIATATLPFSSTHGRTSMEYYDGFVFTFTGPDHTQPPLASGGRYDALTAALGGGAAIPAVGGVIRPALLEGLLCA